MPSNRIFINERVSLPADPTQKLGIVAVSGAGKSYAAGKLAEQWHAADVPIAVLDPVGIWWGLRAGATENDRGLPIPIFGGPHGDTPLPDARVSAWHFACRHSLILDLSELRMSEIHLWVAQFCEQLMAPGYVPVVPCRVILEEAPVFIPQSGWLSENQRDCKAAIAHLARVGRNRGYGMDIITQRAAAVDKNVLTQCGNLLLLRLAAAIDRKSITEWVASNASDIDVKQSLAELSSMPNGEGYLWAPTWSGEPYQRVKVGRRQTLHPGPGTYRAQVPLVPVELPPMPSAETTKKRSAWSMAKGAAYRSLALAGIGIGIWVVWNLAKAMLAVAVLAIVLKLK